MIQAYVTKIIERVIARQILAHMVKNNLLDKFQSAYRELQSTETALLRVFNDLLQALDKGKCAFLIMLDLSAAFDTVDHETLLVFLNSYIGLSDAVLESLKTVRNQCVSIKNVLSHLSELIFGVPQG